MLWPHGHHQVTFSRFSRVNVVTPLAVVLQPESSDPTHTDPTLMFFVRQSVLEILLLVVSRDKQNGGLQM